MFQEIDLEWVDRNPQAALDMIDRLMAERDEAQALAKAAAAGYAASAEGRGWQPIDTVPLTSEDILVGCWVIGEDGQARWSCWTIAFGDELGCDGEWGDPPTHWMPLPTPPITEGSKGE